MYTILEESDNGRKLRNFRTLQWNSSNTHPNTPTKTFWNVRTQVHLHKFLMFMQMKYYFESMSVFESRMLFDAPGVLKDNLFISLLKARYFDVPSNILLQRLQFLQRYLQRPEWTLNLYYTYKNNIVYELKEIRRSIRKVKKYSGYVKSPSAVGTKKSRISIHDPETFEWESYEELDYFDFLTVGKFSGSSLELQFP